MTPSTIPTVLSGGGCCRAGLIEPGNGQQHGTLAATATATPGNTNSLIDLAAKVYREHQGNTQGNTSATGGVAGGVAGGCGKVPLGNTPSDASKSHAGGSPERVKEALERWRAHVQGCPGCDPTNRTKRCVEGRRLDNEYHTEWRRNLGINTADQLAANTVAAFD